MDGCADAACGVVVLDVGGMMGGGGTELAAGDVDVMVQDESTS